jgi:hypothetical protein
MRGNNWAFLAIAAALALAIMSCNFPGAGQTGEAGGAETEVVSQAAGETPTSLDPTMTVQSTDTPAATETQPPQSTATNVQPTATSGPTCTVLQSLNFRKGPGTAYRPPILALPENAQVIPLGYNPVGVPGGPWVQVQYEAAGQIGWVSAGSQYVSCNIDLTRLPSVEIDPPPPPPLPQTTNSTPDGTFSLEFEWRADFDSQYFLRFRVRDTTAEGDNDGAGIDHVEFTILDDNGDQVYQHTENTAGYCIFGGGEPNCNPWTLEDYVYKWEPGGQPVQEGQYQLLVVVTAESSEQSNWTYQVEVALP